MRSPMYNVVLALLLFANLLPGTAARATPRAVALEATDYHELIARDPLPPLPKRPLSPGALDSVPPRAAPGLVGAPGRAGAPFGVVPAGFTSNYVRPASYRSGNVDFVKNGDDLIAKMRDPPNEKDIENNSKEVILRDYDIETAVKTGVVQDLDGVLGPAFRKFNIRDDKNWIDVDIVHKNEGHYISMTTYNKDYKVFMVNNVDRKTMVEKAKAQGLAAKDVPYLSDLWWAGHGPVLGEAKYVIRAQIVNRDTIEIIRESRAIIAPGREDVASITIRADSTVTAEKEAFAALAGSDNGSTVFRTVTDKHVSFGERKVIAVHVWGANRGQGTAVRDVPGGAKENVMAPIMVWELE